MKKIVEKVSTLTDDFDNDLYYDLEEFQKEENYELGMKAKSIEIAKKLLKLNVDIDIIIKSTSLTLDEIEEIKNENNHD